VKEFLRGLAQLGFVRSAVRLMLAIVDALSRAASVLRAAAIFKGGTPPVCHWSVTVKYPENVTCGVAVVIGPKTTLGALGGILLGDHVRISEGVLIETAGLDFSGPPPYPHVAKPIVIERGVWIGARAIILGGVTICEGSIVGAGAIVTQSVPPNSVVVGAATRLISRRHDLTYPGAQ
jgi:acetyltransferase-like isoleucine patch superfamily enzyme